jgi:hypothetical protein
MKRGIAVFLISGAVLLIFAIAQPAQAQTFDTQLNVGLLNLLPPAVTTDPPGNFHHVQPADFDPGKTYLVQATWLSGLGCPTNAFIAVPNLTFTGVEGTAPFVDTGCPTGDSSDHHNEGLLLVKTGPTNNFAAATAELTNVKGITLNELGYDIRKSGGSGGSPLGSHCGAGAPRFDVVTSDGTVHFVGCNSPPGIVMASSTGWVRLRWGAIELLGAFPPITSTDVVTRIVIVFDEGTDASGGPDQFGAAILDNIDVNGTLVGEGSVTAN